MGQLQVHIRRRTTASPSTCRTTARQRRATQGSDLVLLRAVLAVDQVLEEHLRARPEILRTASVAHGYTID